MFRHFILSVIFTLTVTFSTAIDYWQPYPINATVATNGWDFRIECSVYDSLLGSWQYYNSPWIETPILNLKSNNTGVIVFNTFLTQPTTIANNRDSIFGFIIYDQEIHQFKPVYKSNQEHYNGADISAGATTVNYFIDYSDDANALFSCIYDINFHDWKELSIVIDPWDIHDPFPNSAVPPLGTFTAVDWYDDNIYNWHTRCAIYDPVLQERMQIFGYMTLPGTLQRSTIDLALLLSPYSSRSNYCYDAELHAWPHYSFYNHNYFTYSNGIFFAGYAIPDGNKIGIYDDLLHKWAIDTVYKSVSKIRIKDRVVAYADTINVPQQVFYQAYSPTSRTWVKDSSTVNAGIDSIYIQDGTVYWVDFNSTTNFSGYIDTSGWGNYTTPLLLNFNLTDLTSQSGAPMIFVRNYSIGTDSVWYDFGDGIMTDNFKQQSLWHLYKLNGHYSYNAQSITSDVCIYANTSSGIQSSCAQYSQTFCSVPGIMTMSSTSICEGDSIVLSLVGYTGNVQWQSRNQYYTNWVDETGIGSNTDYFVTIPDTQRIYRAKITNGVCAPAFSSPDSVSVFQLPLAGIVSIQTDSTCIGSSVKLNIAGAIGFIQWQSNYGLGWVNETGPGYDSHFGYIAQPTSDVLYHVISSNGSCPIDTSNEISLKVISVTDPVTINDTICGSGTVNLSTNGNGVMSWYNSLNQIAPVFTGNNFSSSISSTTSWYVQAQMGNSMNAFVADTNLGSLSYYSGSGKYGLQFEVSELTTLEVVHVYPQATGNLTISLADVLTNSILDSKTFSVVANSGKTALKIDFTLSPGVVYKLFRDSGSPACFYNTSGATYPMTSPGNPISITGYCDPNLQTGSSYYFFYDWKISQGCKSNFVSVTGVVTSFTTPVVNASGPLSFCQGGNVILSTNTGTGYAYQWYRNGVILSGETGFSYTAYSPGSYTVSVFDSTCGGQMLSTTAYVSVPCVTPFDPQLKESINLETPFMITSYNLSNQSTSVNAQNLRGTTYVLKMFDVLGKEIYSSKGMVTKDGEIGVVFEEIDCTSFAEGYYTLHLQTDQEKLVKQFVNGK